MSVLGPAQPVNPGAALVACEICGATKPYDESYSVMALLAYAPPPVPAFQCPAVQHWGCTLDHAAAAAHACIDEHIVTIHATKLQEAADHVTRGTED